MTIDIRDPIEPNSFYQEFNEPDRGDDSEERRDFGNDDDDQEEMLEYCPNCQAVWGAEEFDFQQCGACGWPDIDDDEDDDELGNYEPIS